MQINIQDIIPFLDKGYVVIDSAERWFWEKYKPTLLVSVASCGLHFALIKVGGK